MENLTYNKRMSTVVPAKMTKEDKKIHQLTNMDLAMKLHYLRGVYFFKSEAVQGFVIFDLKKPFFQLLNVFFPAAGRIRRSEDGGGDRPSINCNDSGVRIIEAQSSKTLVEWMDMIEDDPSFNDELTHRHVLGPDLHFSPLVFVQFTWFKCGGMSVGLSWSHILGDAFTASTFINMWAQILEDQMPRQPPVNLSNPETYNYTLPPYVPGKSLSLKRVDPVGDYWISPTKYTMKTHSFLVSEKQLNHICGLGPISNTNTRAFEYLSAIFWKCIAKIRKEFMAAAVVTICTNCLDTGNALGRNRQIVSTVECDSSVVNADVAHLAGLIANKPVDGGETIKYLVHHEREKNSDYILYGANLTFVNLEEVKLEEMELKGAKAIYSNYVVDGVGENGVVLVLPGLNDGGGGRRVTMVMPEYEAEELKHELKYEWGII